MDKAGGRPEVVTLTRDGSSGQEWGVARALTRVLADRAETTPPLRVKQAHADLGAAASPVELLACSAALEHAALPPVVSEDSFASEPPFRSALVISLGLFGECAALMIGKPGGDGAR